MENDEILKLGWTYKANRWKFPIHEIENHLIQEAPELARASLKYLMIFLPYNVK